MTQPAAGGAGSSAGDCPSWYPIGRLYPWWIRMTFLLAAHRSSLTLAFLLAAAMPLTGQVQIRLGDSAHTLYSEIHEGLRAGSPAADSVRRILGASSSRTLWPIAHGMLEGQVDWNVGLLALTRLAELREPQSLDSVIAWRKRIANEEIPPPPATNLRDVFPVLRAIQLELERGRKGDLALLNDLLTRIPDGYYDGGDAWVFGRLGAGAADSVARRFLETEDQALRIRYLTLLAFSRDTALIPLLARVYVAPDSFSLPPKIGARASDGLVWIGTRRSLQALLDARARARGRGTYADPKLGHAGLDFLGNDSSLVVSRTGKWLTEWVAQLRD